MFAVDVSDLARGRYAFTPTVSGTAAAYRQAFEVRGSGAAGKPVIQESAAYLDLASTASAQWVAYGYGNIWSGNSSINLNWSSLEDWGNG